MATLHWFHWDESVVALGSASGQNYSIAMEKPHFTYSHDRVLNRKNCVYVAYSYVNPFRSEYSGEDSVEQQRQSPNYLRILSAADVSSWFRDGVTVADNSGDI